MTGETARDRKVIRVTGADREEFLQNLVTSDVAGLASGLVYTALLTPQGKYLADFFLAPDRDGILIDVKASIAGDLIRRLSMYKLRAKVSLDPTDITVSRGLGAPPHGAFADPRHPALGWRFYGAPGSGEIADWDSIRVAHLIPETGIELIPGDTYILEAGFERLAGVDFRKGCYVGQEVTARMKHKTELKKGLARVAVSGKAGAGDEITADGKAAGVLHTRAGDEAIAYLRFDRAGGEMAAGEAKLRRI
ncbi:MAG: folate-binding protein [Paracoccaceae bacterium]|nr:folate-binding protein [Paracoccaceae bacterium]